MIWYETHIYLAKLYAFHMKILEKLKKNYVPDLARTDRKG